MMQYNFNFKESYNTKQDVSVSWIKAIQFSWLSYVWEINMMPAEAPVVVALCILIFQVYVDMATELLNGKVKRS